MAWCQRYLHAINAPGGGYLIGSGLGYATTGGYGIIPLPVTMRAQPTLSCTPSQWAIPNGGATPIALTNLTTGVMSHNAVRFDANVAGGITVPQAIVLQSNAAGLLTLSAEL